MAASLLAKCQPWCDSCPTDERGSRSLRPRSVIPCMLARRSDAAISPLCIARAAPLLEHVVLSGGLGLRLGSKLREGLSMWYFPGAFVWEANCEKARSPLHSESPLMQFVLRAMFADGPLRVRQDNTADVLACRKTQGQMEDDNRLSHGFRTFRGPGLWSSVVLHLTSN